MRIIATTSNEAIATVYVGETESGKTIEFVESLQPPLPLDKKWVLIVSTLDGCPAACKFCDAGDHYKGKLSKDDIFDQIDYMVLRRFPDRTIKSEKFKIQFARMGEPALNPAVLDVLRELPLRYNAPGLLPSLSTIAPKGCESFLESAIQIKNELYPNSFQMQFSIHSTDEAQRNELMPIKKLSFKDMAMYGDKFISANNRKVTLNFAYTKQNIVEPKTLLEFFNPDNYLIKITPLNPTVKANQNGLECGLQTENDELIISNAFNECGYETLISIGEREENKIGSNCGQYLRNALNKKELLPNTYSYELNNL